MTNLAFSPDRVTLASISHSDEPRLWDVRSGKPLLTLRAYQFTGLAFNPSGNQIALAGQSAKAAAVIWEVENGRGIRELRGLSANPSRVVFSPDGQLLAALSNDWKVAIWNLDQDRLLHVLGVTPGFFVDSAALAFAKDGKQFAFSAGQRATLYDVKTGNEIKHWNLPPGLQDQLGFHEDRLLLFRYETQSTRIGPSSNNPWTKDPRVCRIRNLFGDEPLTPFRTITEINAHIFATTGTPDGGIFVVEGIEVRNNKRRNVTRAYDGVTGKELWHRYAPFCPYAGAPNIDPAGTVVSCEFNNQKPDSGILVDAKTGEFLERHQPSRKSPAARLYVRSVWGTSDEILVRRKDRKVLLRIALEGDGVAFDAAQFSPDGQYFARGGASGTIYLYNLNAVQQRLAEIDAGW